MASLKRSKPLSKADFDKTITKQSNQLKKEQEARLISQDDEMKYMINSLIRTSKMKQNKMKNNIRPTLLKMVTEIDKKTSTINTYLQKTAEVGVAANSKEIDLTILDQKTQSKPVTVKYKKITLNSEQMYAERFQAQEYRLSPKLRYSSLSRSPNRQLQKPAGIKLKSKKSQSPQPNSQTHQNLTYSPVLRNEQKFIENYTQPITNRKQQQNTSSQPQVMSTSKQKFSSSSKQKFSSSSKQKFAPSSAQQLTPNLKQLQKQSTIQQPVQKSKQEQSLNPKRKQITGTKVRTAPSTKRLPKQINVPTIVNKGV